MVLTYLELLEKIKNEEIKEGTKINRKVNNSLRGSYVYEKGHLFLDKSNSVLEDVNSYEELFMSNFEIEILTKNEENFLKNLIKLFDIVENNVKYISKSEKYLIIILNNKEKIEILIKEDMFSNLELYHYYKIEELFDE